MNNNYHAMFKFIQKQVMRVAAALVCAGAVVSASAQAPAFTNNSFETPVLSSNYATLPGNVGWTVLGTVYQMQNSFIGSNYGFPASPSGNQVVWLSSGSSVRQSVSLPAGNHAITFRVAHSYSSNYVRVTLNGAYVESANAHLAEPGLWHEYTVFTGTVAAGSYLMQFSAYDTSGAATFALLDDIRIVTDQTPAAQLVNGGFEVPDVGTGAFQMGMSGSSWSGSYNAGIFSNSYAAVAGGGSEGLQVGALSSGQYMNQSLTLQPGTYSITTKAAGANDGMGTAVPFAIQLNGGALYSATIAAYDFTFRTHTTPTFTVNAAGTYTVRIQNTGSGGWMLLDAVTIQRLVLPPTVVLTGLTEGGSYTGAVPLSATATAPQGSISQVEFYVNGALVGTVNAGAAGQTGNVYTYSWTPAANASVVVTAKAIMVDGAHATSAPVTINVGPAQMIEPGEIFWQTPYASSFTAPANVPLVVWSYVGGSGIATVTGVRFAQGGNPLQLVLYGVTTDTTQFSYVWENVAPGTYTISAEPITVPQGVTKTRNITVLSPATVTLTSPSSGTSYTGGASVTLTATAAQAGGTISKVEFLSGTTVIGTVLTGASGNTGSTYSFTWTAPNPGANAAAHVISARSTDGNLATATSNAVTITVNPVLNIGLYYVHPDHLGTPRAITRPSDNALVWKWDNTEPFGYNAANENPSGLGIFAYNLRHPGQYADSETGTFYNYHRDYDPATGRYRQSDPIGLRGGLNTYAYVGSNPLRRVDPLGLLGADPFGEGGPEDPLRFMPRVPTCNSQLSCYAKCIAENALACQPLAWGLGLASGTLVGAGTAFFCPPAAPVTFAGTSTAAGLAVNGACQSYLIENRCKKKCEKPNSCEVAK